MRSIAVDRSQGLGAKVVRGRLQPIASSTEDMVAPDRFDAWRDRYCALNDVIVAKQRSHALVARTEDRLIGEVQLSHDTAPARHVVRTARDCAAVGFEYWVLRVRRVGPMLCRSGDSTTRVKRGRLFIDSFRV